MPSHLAGAAWRTSSGALNHICALCSVQYHGVDLLWLEVINMWSYSMCVYELQSTWLLLLLI